MHFGALAGGLGSFPFDCPTYLIQSDSRAARSRHSEFDKLRQALTPKASPKAISGRTSYLRVRLEFLRYPHLITTLFNGCVFGPPSPFTAASTWTWIGHPVSGLPRPTFALLRLGFPPAPDFTSLTSPDAAARRTVLQKVRGPPDVS